MQKKFITKIEIEETRYVDDNNAVVAEENIITVDGEIYYKEYRDEFLLSKNGRTGQIVYELKKDLLYSSFKKGKPTENSTGNGRNFISRIKLIWRKLFF